MKIKSINIDAFGMLENFSLDFTDGMNIVYGENENGKSTVMAFIKMMFYGGKGGSKIKTSRSKYFPWSGKAPAGSITFEHKGRNYRIEREFKGSNSTDKVYLFDLDMGTKTAAAADIGRELFGLSEAAFERSIFIGALTGEKSDSEAEGEINAKLSNLSTGGDEDISYTKVLSRLEKAKNSLTSKKGTAGIMDKNIAKIKTLEEQYTSAYFEQKRIIELKENAHSLAQEISQLEASIKQVKEKIEISESSKNTEKIKELLSLKASLDELNESLSLNDGKVIDEIFVKTVTFSLRKLENTAQKIDAKRNEEQLLKSNIALLQNPSEDMTEENAHKLSSQIEELKTKVADCEAKKTNTQECISAKNDELNAAKAKKKAFNPLLLIAAFVTLASGVLFFILDIAVAAIPLCAAGFIFLVLSFILRPYDDTIKNKLNSEIYELQSLSQNLTNEGEKLLAEINLLSEKFKAINTVLAGNSAVLHKQQENLAACEEETAQLLIMKLEEEKKLIEFYSRYKLHDSVSDIAQELESITEHTNRQREIKQQLNYIVKDLGNISYEKAKQLLEAADTSEVISNEDTEALNAEFERLNALITDKKSSYSALITEIKILEKNTIIPCFLTGEISELKHNVASQEQFCRECEIATQVLTESFAQLRRSYGSVLEKKSAEILCQLTLGEYTDMSISNSFEINVEKKDVFGQKEIDYLSAGTADQAYLSLRLALASLMEVGVSLPVLLDDPFIQYDDSRTKKALEFFNSFAKEHQVILFTCHGFVANGCEENCNNLIKL